ncbi:MAG: hypothetical protein ACIAQU_11775 [Phycisphaerales bacterium JB064]
MLEADLAMLPEAVRRWRPLDEVRSARAAWIDGQLACCENRGIATNRAAMVMAGAPRDFQNVIVEVAGARTLCGIRHYGGDVNRPFVDLVATTDAGAWRGERLVETSAAACRAYPAFHVPMTRVPVAGSEPPPLPPVEACDVRACIDQALVGSTLGEMLARAPECELPGVSLRATSVDEAMAFEADSYDALAERALELSGSVRPSGLEEIEACAEAGRVVNWYLEDEPERPAGLLCVQRLDFQAMDGFLVVEECVARWAAGRRSAAAAQRELARVLIAEDGANAALPMFGTILGQNVASLTTARRAGRERIGAVWFLRHGA